MISSWKIFHKEETASTNIDARSGGNGDVFTASFQSLGRGRLDHKWYSPAEKNLLLSAVVGVKNLQLEQVSTLPIVAGMAVLSAISKHFARSRKVQLKWPNDVMLDGKKVAGVLCERRNDNVIVGIGINVKSQEFPREIASRATFLGDDIAVEAVRDAVLDNFKELIALWECSGFEAIQALITQDIDFLYSKKIKVIQTDDDDKPFCAVARGINIDGSLRVGCKNIFAGEVHLEY